MSLQVKALSKSYGNNIVLNQVSFVVQPGEIVCLRGKSGEGKTTLLRCLNRLEKPDSGQILIDEIDIMVENKGLSIAEKIGLVFQNYNLFPHKNVMENLLLAPRLLKQGENEMKKRAVELLKQLGIEDKADQYPFQLSGGQKQRVAIARACMLSPQVLCFDEPTSALDRESIEGICRIMLDLSKQGMMILIVTHDEEFAERIAMRSLVLEKGRMTEGDAKGDDTKFNLFVK
ncbi:amino acid ABC transporter ATP-binding protein [Clostridiales bacterium COT073_COT-073]|nr:amino acid ABC transporter ATP-binding protein [Clostridiales bacterium COT073_COT-073]